ncbi:DNA methyltransferase [Argonema galeatum]|uniref:DNA methyltransferase n=1 Tax=Argonema galeatum TaxID=2942762 RepID=UPI002012D097|nr:DNA methyltransferase [Argonema galeatum]MCL1467365.1 hypothetical protein [Argonema galeatum A003/A1]
MPQNKLDLMDRERTSFYPWRGQFSPGLVDLLLDAYAQDDTVVIDPFVGSGTTLFEASRRGLKCYGSEINPAAILFARQAKFANINIRLRSRIFTVAEELIEKHIGDYLPPTLFRIPKNQPPNESIKKAAMRLLNEAASDEMLHSLLLTTVTLAMGNGDVLTGENFELSYERNRAIVSNLSFTSRPCHVFMSDARGLPLPEKSVDLVISSPPYINVFNYHQNYRKAMEMLGWHLLDIAPSEMGSNRKHRGNRFMTPVQFCIDLMLVLAELRRILHPDGTAIFVMGRESRVRGIAFNNSHLLALCAVGGAGFNIERWQERKFTNRFGITIYEDILTLKPDCKILDTPSEFGRQVGVLALQNASNIASGEVLNNIKQAIERSGEIPPSPYFKPSLQSPIKLGAWAATQAVK